MGFLVALGLLWVFVSGLPMLSVLLGLAAWVLSVAALAVLVVVAVISGRLLGSNTESRWTQYY